eukprot:1177769-Prorocentrum_minimum.AAC.3
MLPRVCAGRRQVAPAALQLVPAGALVPGPGGDAGPAGGPVGAPGGEGGGGNGLRAAAGAGRIWSRLGHLYHV